MAGKLPAVALSALGVGLAVAATVRVRADATRATERAAVQAALPAVRDGFVGSGACRACHPAQYASWHDTYHRTMTQPALGEAVLGAFDGRTLPDGTVAERDASGVWFRAAGQRRRVVMTTGSHHMQVYWHAADDGSLRSAKWAWLGEPGPARFVPNDATLLRPPADAPVAFTWNRVCIKCHAVAGNPGFDATTQTVHSETGELGIACEACHGAASAHVERHRDPRARWAAHETDAPDPSIVQPGRLPTAPASEVCGQCHSITVFADDDAWVAQGRTHEVRVPAAHDPIAAWGMVARHPLRADQPRIDPVLDENPDFFEDRFWSDGMVRVSGREYNGLLESPCFASGELSCLSCHAMHDAPADDQLRPAARGDEVCAGCHAEVATAGAAHGHHDPVRVGCMDCHMPHTTYGLLKAIRSHEVDVPRVAVARETGRPLACDLCHLDRSTKFSAQALARWYGHEVPEDLPDAPASIVGALSGDAGQRALWAWHLGWDRATGAGPWRASILAQLLVDPYPAVRIVTERALHRAGLVTPTVDPLHDGDRARAEVMSGSVDPIASDVIERWARQRDDRPVRLAE